MLSSFIEVWRLGIDQNCDSCQLMPKIRQDPVEVLVFSSWYRCKNVNVALMHVVLCLGVNFSNAQFPKQYVFRGDALHFLSFLHYFPAIPRWGEHVIQQNHYRLEIVTNWLQRRRVSILIVLNIMISFPFVFRVVEYILCVLKTKIMFFWKA